MTTQNSVLTAPTTVVVVKAKCKLGENCVVPSNIPISGTTLVTALGPPATHEDAQLISQQLQDNTNALVLVKTTQLEAVKSRAVSFAQRKEQIGIAFLNTLMLVLLLVINLAYKIPMLRKLGRAAKNPIE
jgi:hypothetical protein